MQANAEPDLQQTGDRLKLVVAGLVEGIMQLVVDPLAHSQVKPPPPFPLQARPPFPLQARSRSALPGAYELP